MTPSPRRRPPASRVQSRRPAPPIVVVGDPDSGAHTRLYRAYSCGDLCVDKVVQVADITPGPVPGIADDSAVVFVSCVLEYVGDAAAAVAELRRMAGAASPDGSPCILPSTTRALSEMPRSTGRFSATLPAPGLVSSLRMSHGETCI